MGESFTRLDDLTKYQGLLESIPGHGRGYRRQLGALDAEDLTALRQESPIRELVDFLVEVGQPVVSLPSIP